jgi:hypothetical protein
MRLRSVMWWDVGCIPHCRQETYSSSGRFQEFL